MPAFTMTEENAKASSKVISNDTTDVHAAPKAKSRSSRRRKHEKEKKDGQKKDGKAIAGKHGTTAGDDDAALKGKSVARKKPGKKKKRKKSGKTGKEGRGADAYDDAEEEGSVKLKVVVRRLPPHLPEAVFWKAVAPWAHRIEKSEGKGEGGARASQSADLTDVAIIEQGYFVPGKLKENSRRAGHGVRSDASSHTHSRAYLCFQSPEALVRFHRGFNGHVFRDGKGSESVAVVEFAPFQRMPGDGVRKKARADTLQGTIEDDADYKSFIALSEEKPSEEDKSQSTAEKTDAQLMAHLSSLAEANQAQRQAKSTPLLDHLRQQRTAKAEAAALKHARNHLNKTHGAYAASAATAPAVASTRGSRGKKKAKGVLATPVPGQPHDPSIPTGPKAMRSDKGSSSISKKKEKKEKKEKEKKEQGGKGEPSQTGKEKGKKGSGRLGNAVQQSSSPASKATLGRAGEQADVSLPDIQKPTSPSGRAPAGGESGKNKTARRTSRPRASDTVSSSGEKKTV